VGVSLRSIALRIARGDRASFVAQATLWIVLGFVLASLLFNGISSALGLAYPYNSFLFRPDDRFADFFKMCFSYPGAPIHPPSGFWRMDDLLAHHLAEVKEYEGTNVNHFHQPPIPTLLALSARWLMGWMDPVLLFLGLLAASFAALFATVLTVSPASRAGAAFGLATILSYPALLAIDRGHFFSLFCGALLIAATLRTLRGGADFWTILMFAIAVNFKPNAGVIPFVLFLGRQGISFRGAMLLAALSVLLFVGTLGIVHQIYPEYTFQRFLRGLAQYGMAYAGGENGFLVGSSFYGMFRTPLGYSAWMVYPPMILAAAVLAPAILEVRDGRLRQSECLFLTLAGYVFGSHVFADYHLLVFIIPTILLAREEGSLDLSGWTILIPSSLMLAPKNFIFSVRGDMAWSWQIVGNPLILLLASVVVIWAAWRRNARAKDRPAIEAPAAA